MRNLVIPSLLFPFVLACGPKAPPATSADAAEAVEAPAPEPEAEPEPEPEPEPAAAPAPTRNANLNLTIKRADGTSQTVQVLGIERSLDTHGETDWSTEASDLKFYIEGNDEYKKITWDDVKAASFKVPDKKNFDCLYQSDFTPWMYECSVKIETQITTKDGKRYTADSAQKWRFIFSDDTSTEFWLKRHYARAQDDRTIEIDDTNTQNYALYEQLQDQLRGDLDGLIQTIAIQ